MKVPPTLISAASIVGRDTPFDGRHLSKISDRREYSLETLAAFIAPDKRVAQPFMPALPAVHRPLWPPWPASGSAD
jgi:hypothetical protein